MNKILVTGATGLLGSSLTPYLKKCGHEIVTHSRNMQADIKFDLSDMVKTHQMLEQIQPDIIVNLVSVTNVDLCEEQINLAYLANTRTVENLANWIAFTDKDTHLVQISTDHVYDGKDLHMEDSVTIVNNYAFSKYSGELAALRVPSTILRTNFVGRSQVHHRDSLTDWLYRSIESNKQIQVLSDVYFSPLSLRFLVKMIELVVQKKPIGVFNLGSHNGLSKADFAFSFVEHLKLPTRTMTRIQGSEAKFFHTYRPQNMRMNSSKFENTLGVKLPNLSDLIQSLAEEFNDDA